ncbi:hypothetical protein VTJ49DRAFT_1569 [Mycothermus thermophilus]|uniref:C2H2-type domain-containing protein n=1 Tax=Humicola insolens TaxID=85995 RepID=A0ABR3VNI8_HUMIN
MAHQIRPLLEFGDENLTINAHPANLPNADILPETDMTGFSITRFSRLDALQRHVRTKHQAPPRTYPCNLDPCNGSRAFKRRDHYRQHLRCLHQVDKDGIDIFLELDDLHHGLVTGSDVEGFNDSPGSFSTPSSTTATSGNSATAQVTDPAGGLALAVPAGELPRYTSGWTAAGVLLEEKAPNEALFAPGGLALPHPTLQHGQQSAHLGRNPSSTLWEK